MNAKPTHMAPRRRGIWLSLLITALFGQAASAMAADFPCDTVRLVEPYPAGGGATSIIARMVADELSNDIGKTVIVDNRPGASGNIGSAFVARAKPDGCTLLIGTDATHAGNYYLFKDFPYHPVNDFTPITMAAKNLLVLVANPSLPVKSIDDLIQYAHDNPGKLFYGTPGIGSPHHLSGELFNQLANTEINHVPYSGNGPAMSDVLGGQIMLMYSSMAPALPHIQEGKFIPLGITEDLAFSSLPNLPPIKNNLPEFEMGSWIGFFAPAGLSDEILSALHKSITKTLTAPDAVKRLNDLGLVSIANSPEEFSAQLKASFEQRGELIRSTGIRLE
ncbi:MAG: tripartite tricarboxylate transporter substrate-binding protein [Pigmentiphaga sp.]|nr:tripartite tricarboxylate transporter substrate-binding protein [Pigmentiphaga sp.]